MSYSPITCQIKNSLLVQKKCVRRVILFFWLVKAGLQKQSASSFVAGYVVLFYINRFHPVDVLHLYTQLEKNATAKYSPCTSRLRWSKVRETRRVGLGSFCIVRVGLVFQGCTSPRGDLKLCDLGQVIAPLWTWLFSPKKWRYFSLWSFRFDFFVAQFSYLGTMPEKWVGSLRWHHENHFSSFIYLVSSQGMRGDGTWREISFIDYQALIS